MVHIEPPMPGPRVHPDSLSIVDHALVCRIMEDPAADWAWVEVWGPHGWEYLEHGPSVGEVLKAPPASAATLTRFGVA
jgi:hypothetical protein